MYIDTSIPDNDVSGIKPEKINFVKLITPTPIAPLRRFATLAEIVDKWYST